MAKKIPKQGNQLSNFAGMNTTNFLQGRVLLLLTAATLSFTIALQSCEYGGTPAPQKCDGSLAITSQAQASTCGLGNGSLSANATGGSGNYQYSLDGGITKQTSNQFTDLTGGVYTIMVFDGTCFSSTTQVVETLGSTLEALLFSSTPNTDYNSFNGTATIVAEGGTGEYTFTLNATTNATGIFENLSGGFHTVEVSDGECTINIQFNVDEQVNVSFAAEVLPIFQAKCNYPECHSFNTHSSIFNQRSIIKEKISNNSMPKAPRPDLTNEELGLIVCWIDAGALNN